MVLLDNAYNDGMLVKEKLLGNVHENSVAAIHSATLRKSPNFGEHIIVKIKISLLSLCIIFHTARRFLFSSLFFPIAFLCLYPKNIFHCACHSLLSCSTICKKSVSSPFPILSYLTQSVFSSQTFNIKAHKSFDDNFNFLYPQ